MKTTSIYCRIITFLLIVIGAIAPISLHAVTNDTTVVSSTVKPRVTVGCVVGVLVIAGGVFVIYKLYGVCKQVLPPNPPPPPNTNNVTKASMFMEQSSSSSPVTPAAYFATPEKPIIGNGNLPFCIQCSVSDTANGTSISLDALPVDMAEFAAVQGTSIFEGTGIPTNSGLNTNNYSYDGVASLISYSGNQFNDGVIKTVAADGSQKPFHIVVLQVSVDMVNWQDVMTFESQYTEHVITGTYGQETVFFRAKLLSGSPLQEL